MLTPTKNDGKKENGWAGVFFFSGRIYFINNDVSREFDEFQVNTRTHLCKLRCWYS